MGTEPWHQVTFTHIFIDSHQGRFRIKRLAQGHIGTRTGGAGDETIDILASGLPSAPPEPRPPYGKIRSSHLESQAENKFPGEEQARVRSQNDECSFKNIHADDSLTGEIPNNSLTRQQKDETNNFQIFYTSKRDHYSSTSSAVAANHALIDS